MVREARSLDFVVARLVLRQRPLLMPDLAFGLPLPLFLLFPPIVCGAALRVGVTVIDRAAQTKIFDQQAIYEDAILSLLLNLQQAYAAHIFIFVQCLAQVRTTMIAELLAGFMTA